MGNTQCCTIWWRHSQCREVYSGSLWPDQSPPPWSALDHCTLYSQALGLDERNLCQRDNNWVTAAAATYHHTAIIMPSDNTYTCITATQAPAPAHSMYEQNWQPIVDCNVEAMVWDGQVGYWTTPSALCVCIVGASLRGVVFQQKTEVVMMKTLWYGYSTRCVCYVP